MQIGLMSRRALQGPGLWELIPSLHGRNRPPFFPTPPAAPQHSPLGREAANPWGGRGIRPQAPAAGLGRMS